MPKRELDTAHFDHLFKVILELKTVDECKKFFRDLCTISELQALSERWEVVLLLEQGVSYREISSRTGASTATVTRVAHWLNHGEGGYGLVLKRLGKLKK